MNINSMNSPYSENSKKGVFRGSAAAGSDGGCISSLIPWDADAVLVSGGDLDDGFARQVIRSAAGAALCCADRGAELFFRLKLRPDTAIGDFDSTSREAVQWLNGLEGTRVVKLNPVKDDTDTQAALNDLMDRGHRSILILGAFGGRMDHTLSNLGLLLLARKRGGRAALLDPVNRITLPSSPSVLDASGAYGQYISFFPFGGNVEGLTLEGFRYPLRDRTLTAEDYGLTVSNELAASRGRIEYRSGNLVMVESKS